MLEKALCSFNVLVFFEFCFYGLLSIFLYFFAFCWSSLEGNSKGFKLPFMIEFCLCCGAWCSVKVLMSTPDDMVLNHLNLKSVEVATPSLRH